MTPKKTKKRTAGATEVDRWARLTTEAANPASRALDRMSARAIARLIARQDAQAVAAVARVTDRIAEAAELFAATERSGGRAVYVGAGTSGRLGVLDAAELPPTFGTPKFGRRSAHGVMSGGYGALRRSVEGAEDDAEAGAAAIRKLKLDQRDLVIGISASSLAPYVVGALCEAKKRKSATVLVTMNRISRPKNVDVLIACEVGPEILAGSTRMKSGLATKAILHNISTSAMVLSGKVYGNRMVDLKPWSAKLRARGVRLIGELGEVDAAAARVAYESSGRDPKTAIVMVRRGVAASEARRLLRSAKGDLRAVLEQRD